MKIRTLVAALSLAVVSLPAQAGILGWLGKDQKREPQPVRHADRLKHYDVHKSKPKAGNDADHAAAGREGIRRFQRRPVHQSHPWIRGLH